MTKFQHCSNCGEEMPDLSRTGLLFPDLCPLCFYEKMTTPSDDFDEVDEYPSLEEELAADEAREHELLNDEDDTDDGLDDGFDVFFNPEE